MTDEVSDVLERRLAAVMFTDMVGYTALIQTDALDLARSAPEIIAS